MLVAPLAIDLATFDGSAPHKWTVENDPVMGGQSFSNFSLTTLAGNRTVGEWMGQCRIVPSLQAPGFTIALTEEPALSTFPSVVGEDGLEVRMHNLHGNITSFNVAFCDTHINPYRCQFGTFKATFKMPHTNGFHTAFVPWSSFSDKWDPATGQHTEENPPTNASLASISQVQLWVEGLAGDFHVLIDGIRTSKKP